MGQQQLLLIVLGVIIVGIAVVVGINVFSASSLQANNDAVIADLTNMGSMAQQYYRKPSQLGGGGQDFGGWKIPGKLVSTPNGTYSVSDSGSTATYIVLQGKGNEVNNSGHTLLVSLRVEPSDLRVVSTNVND